MARFDGSGWRATIDVAAFIHDNVTPYEGDATFLTGATPRTERIWRQLQRMFVEERRRGIYDVDTHTVDEHLARPRLPRPRP